MLDNSEGQQRAQRLEQRPRRVQVIVIGAGQAGLAAGRYLAQAGVDFLILEAADRVGDVWRNRWDSLRLFTAAEFAGLPGLPYPGDPDALPTKDQLADYLEAYASTLQAPGPLQYVSRTTRARRRSVCDYYEQRHFRSRPRRGRDRIASNDRDSCVGWLPGARYRPDSVERLQESIATGSWWRARCRRRQQRRGAGAGGGRAGHRVWLSGRDVGQVPRFFRFANGRPFWFLATRVFTMKTPIGRKIRKALRAGDSGPPVRIRSREIPMPGSFECPE